MILKDLFPTLSRFPPIEGLPWHQALHSLAQVGTAAIIVTAEIENQHATTGTDKLVEVATAARDDVLSQRAAGNLPTALVDFLQLWVSIHPAHQGIATGRLGLAHDWLLAALDDNPVGSSEVDVQLQRLPAMLTAPLPGAARENVQPAVLMWLADLYYYSRNQGVLRDIARAALEFAVSFVPQCPPNDASAALGQIAGWALVNDAVVAQTCVELLQRWYRGNELAPAQRAGIAVLFCTTVGALTRRTPAQWAAATLRRHSSELRGHERLQVLTSALGAETIEAIRSRWPEVRVALEEHRRLFSGGADDSYGASRLFRVASPLLNVLLPVGPVGAADLALDLLAELRRVPAEAARRKGPDLIVLPNHQRGTLYATIGGAVLQESQVSISDVIRAVNGALGMVMNVEDDPSFVLERPRNLGVPDLDQGENFERVMFARLGLVQARSNLRAAPFAGCRGMVDVSGLPVPWQSLTVRGIGKAWPVIRSFEEPKPDRKIEHVLYWSAGSGGTFTSHIEMDAIQTAFGQRLLIVNGDDGGRDRFLAEYQRKDLDLIWVDGHGQYDQYAPHAAALRVSGTEVVKLEDLRRLDISERGRRLVVFNVCEGGATASLNAPGELGLAASIASASQAVISHICPVTPLAALFFGILLSERLAAGQPFFASFESALTSMLGGKGLIREGLSSHPYVLECLDRCTLRLESVLDAGTAVFYE